MSVRFDRCDEALGTTHSHALLARGNDLAAGTLAGHLAFALVGVLTVNPRCS
jgi:hypothetical protein